MDPADAHRQLTQVTGGREVSDLNAVATAFGRATTALEEFAAAVRKLVDTAAEIVDDEGREIWLRAGEVELDQWTQRLIDATAVLRQKLG